MAKAIVNETMTFGACYIGNEEILGWQYIEKMIKKIQKLSKNVWFEDKEGDWYAVKVR